MIKNKNTKSMMAVKHLAFMCAFMNPFNTLQSVPLIRHQSSSYLVAMAPDGGHMSREATNRINPPGCSINQSRTNKPDGSVEIRETLTCTTVTTISPSDKVTTKPSSGSKSMSEEDFQHMKDFILDFLKKRK